MACASVQILFRRRRMRDALARRRLDADRRGRGARHAPRRRGERPDAHGIEEREQDGGSDRGHEERHATEAQEEQEGVAALFVATAERQVLLLELVDAVLERSDRLASLLGELL